VTKAKRRSIERRLQADPGASNRALAKEFAIDHKTVAAIRISLSGGEFPHAKARLRKRAPGNDQSAQLAPIEDADPPAADPAQVLREIANDPTAPATARVQAAKALIAMQRPSADERAAEKVDRVTARALQLIDGGKA
jgi:hypothetical protein